MASIANLLTVAFLSHFFSIEDYATYQQTFLSYQIVSPFLGLGIPMALYFFLSNEKVRPGGVIIENFILLLFLALLFSGFLAFGGSQFYAQKMQNPALAYILLLLIPYPVFQIIERILPACLMTANRYISLTLFNVLNRVLTCAFVISIALLVGTVKSVVISIVAFSGISFVVGIWLIIRTYHSREFKPRLKGMSSQLCYGLPLGLAMIFGTLITAVGKLIVSMNCSTHDFTIYVNGTVQLPFIGIITMSIAAVLLPEMTSYYKSGKTNELLGIWQKALVKGSYCIYPIAIFVFIFAENVIVVIFSDKYLESTTIFRIFLLFLLFRTVSWGSVFHSSNTNKYIVITNIISISIFIPLVYFATIHFGIVGAVVVLVLVLACLHTFLQVLFISKVLAISPFAVVPFNRLWKPAILSLICAIPLALTFTFYLNPVLKLITFGLYYFPCIYFILSRYAEGPRFRHAEIVIEKIFKN